MKEPLQKKLVDIEYVVLDIETTGLDLKHSSIIEVGAVLVSGNKIQKSFSSFVRYDGVLPETIKRVTGISEDMLKGAPKLPEVMSKFKDFIGKKPVVAHNGFSFDFPILERHGLKLNEKYDSMEFAFFVLPTNITGHSTATLTQYFSIKDVPHRALADSQIEFEIIVNLQKEYLKGNKKKREALNYLAKSIQWWWYNFLSGDEAKVDRISDLVSSYEPYRKENASQEMLDFTESNKVDVAEIDKYFNPLLLPKSSDSEMDYSEDRPEQRKMASIVALAFNEHKHAVIEAGTGIGKSKAYLAPALVFSMKNGVPVIISTHTKALQDQLFVKEIPHLRDIINPDLRVALLKGKKNYVCLQKFEEFSKEVQTELSQRSLYEFGQEGTKFSTRLAYLLIASWIIKTERGDWDELPYWFKERIPKRIEQDICNFDELCGNGTCELYEKQKCFLAKARIRAKDADIVVVNHALTLSGIVVDEEQLEEGGEIEKVYSHTVFPGEAKFLVFDEAHYLEDDVTSAWENIISYDGMQYLFNRLFGKSGAKSYLGGIARDNPELAPKFEEFDSKEKSVKANAGNLFDLILPQAVPENNSDGFSTYAMLDEVPAGLREAINTSLNNIKINLKDAAKIIDTFADQSSSSKVQKILQVKIKNIKGFIEPIDCILSEGKEYVKYLKRFGRSVEIKATPLSVAHYLKDYVYDNFSSVIMTSATLTANKSFNFFANRCGTCFIEKEQVGYHSLKSSFDYAKQVKFYVPEGIAYSGGKDKHLEKSAEFLEKAILASDGGALVLCMSHKQVDALYGLLSGPLSNNNVWLLRQNRGVSVGSVVRDFKRSMNSALIGTESLWQGIDVPGMALRSLFIYKIPYRMPFHPVLKARKQEIEDRGGDSFAEYYEPLAALMLKQGFGRLIRKCTDSGIAVLLDEDLLSKPRLLNSLPDGVSPQKVSPEFIISEFQNFLKSIIAEEEVKNESDKELQMKSQVVADELKKSKTSERKFNCQICGRPIRHRGNCLKCNVSKKKSESHLKNEV